jgi:hypothetical protein
LLGRFSAATLARARLRAGSSGAASRSIGRASRVSGRTAGGRWPAGSRLIRWACTRGATPAAVSDDTGPQRPAGAESSRPIARGENERSVRTARQTRIARGAAAPRRAMPRRAMPRRAMPRRAAGSSTPDRRIIDALRGDAGRSQVACQSPPGVERSDGQPGSDVAPGGGALLPQQPRAPPQQPAAVPPNVCSQCIKRQIQARNRGSGSSRPARLPADLPESIPSHAQVSVILVAALRPTRTTRLGSPRLMF